jgi:ketosteroid isomerase-like protein
MTDTALLQALNDDIWYPFPRTYLERDAQAHLALFAPELIRAGGKEVIDFETYATQMRGFFATVAERGDAFTIDFRFTERLAAGGLACERGVFRITATLALGEGSVSYGRFHVFARQIDGRWRITADHDTRTDQGGPVSEDHFAAAKAVDDLAAFAD